MLNYKIIGLKKAIIFNKEGNHTLIIPTFINTEQ